MDESFPQADRKAIPFLNLLSPPAAFTSRRAFLPAHFPHDALPRLKRHHPRPRRLQERHGHRPEPAPPRPVPPLAGLLMHDAPPHRRLGHKRRLRSSSQRERRRMARRGYRSATAARDGHAVPEARPRHAEQDRRQREQRAQEAQQRERRVAAREHGYPPIQLKTHREQRLRGEPVQGARGERERDGEAEGQREEVRAALGAAGRAGDAEPFGVSAAVGVPLGAEEDGGELAVVEEVEEREDGLRGVGDERVLPHARGPVCAHRRAREERADVDGAEAEVGQIREAAQTAYVGGSVDYDDDEDGEASMGR